MNLVLNISFRLLFFACFFLSVANAQTITFEKTFGGANNDKSNSVQQTADGGSIIAGRTTSFGVGSYDVYLIRTDTNGDSLWTKTFGGTNVDVGYSVQQTTDGGFIIAGLTQNFGAGSDDVYLIRTDTNGDSLWTKTFGGAGADWGNSVQQTTDGGFIIAGWTVSFGAGAEDVYLIKIDANGNSVWAKTFGGTGSEHGYSVQQTIDGGYIIAGYTASFGAGDADVYLIRTDANGDSLWTKTFGGTSSEYGLSVYQTSDGGSIIAGRTMSFGAGSWDIYLIKTDANGEPLWTKTFGETNSDDGNSVQQTSDGGYIIVGLTQNFGAGSDDVYLIKTDANGDSLWTKTFGGANADKGYSVQQTTDGGYIIAGYTASFGVSTDVYLIKTDSLGKVFPTVTIPTNNTHFSVVSIYPNPVSEAITVSLSSDMQNSFYEIYDLTGRKVERDKVIASTQKISLKNYTNGIYLLKISDGEKNYMGKFIKE